MNTTETKRFLTEIAGLGGRIEGTTGIAWAKVLEQWDFGDAMAHLVEVQTRRARPMPADFNRSLQEPAKEADRESLAWSKACRLIQQYGLGSALDLAANECLTGDPAADRAVVAARQDIRYGTADAAWWRFRDAYREATQTGGRPVLESGRPALPEASPYALGGTS